MIGPRSGPREKMAMAPPRSSVTIRSLMDPAPMVMGVTPANPARNRIPISMLMFVEYAQATVKPTNKTLKIWYILRRPYISHNGATTLQVISGCD